MDKKTWIIIANANQARFFECQTVSDWTEIETLVHPQSRMYDRDLSSDRAGSVKDGSGMYPMAQAHSHKENEIRIFAREVAEALELARTRNQFDRVFIASTPAFLGLLRGEMTPSLLKLVEKEVGKDITQMKPEMMKEYFFVGV